MADQAGLDRYSDQLYGKYIWTGEDGNGGINGHSVANLLWNGPAAFRQEVLNSIWATPIDDNENHGAYNAGVVVATMSWRVVALVNAVARLERPTKLVKAKDDPTGAIYAVTQTSFKHISGDLLNAGIAAGLWGGWETVFELPVEQVALLAEYLGGKLFVPPPPVETIDYKIVAKDTLASIAAAHKSTVGTICALNPSITDRNNITLGVVIKLPKV